MFPAGQLKGARHRAEDQISRVSIAPTKRPGELVPSHSPQLALAVRASTSWSSVCVERLALLVRSLLVTGEANYSGEGKLIG